MIIPKNLWRLMKVHASGGRSRHSQLIFHSSSMAQSSSTGPLRKARSSSVNVAGAFASNFDQSGLPVNRSASHQTSPASSASRSVSDIGGNTVRVQEKIGLVMISRRRAWELMAMSSWIGSTAAHCSGKRKIQVILRIEIKAKLIRQ